MISAIRAMIARKQEFIESAKVIYEDVMESEIDDLIILEADEEPKETPKENEETPKEEEKDLLSEPISSGEEKDTKEDLEDGEVDNGGIDNLLNEPIGGDVGGDDMGENPFEEPPQDDNIEDILDVSIDLKSNTIKDVLPVPPENAGEAINDDILNSRISSGFEDDDTTPSQEDDIPSEEDDIVPAEEKDILNSKIGETEDVKDQEESPEEMGESFDILNSLLNEAITLDGEEGGGETPPAETAPAEPATQTTDAPPDTGGDNAVTAAVKDKVSEVQTVDPTPDVTTTPNPGGVEGAKVVHDQLSKVTMEIEKAKKAIVDNLG